MQLYNTLTRKKEIIPPPPEHPVISMYSCGPTVYDDTHIGHMRRYVMDDVLKRSLKFLRYDIKHVMNITDVGHLTGDDDSGEDKLEKGAKKKGKTVWSVAAEYEDQFWNTMAALHVEKDDITVLHATKCIDDMIAIIKKLETNGLTYQTDEALYFDVTKFPHYGMLSGQKLEDKIQGARDDVRIDTQKKHPADFALWFKRVGRFADHTMHWVSPWGDGFPGWHIECSAMSMKGLNAETIDIHTGGIDHIPVHHENEIAQSEGATGKEFVKYWVHHEFLMVDGEKMSKSKQNFYSLKDINDKNIDPLALRYLFLQTHYRKPMNFTWEAVEGATQALENVRVHIIGLRIKLHDDPSLNNLYSGSSEIENIRQQFQSAIRNDLNISDALSVMWIMLKSALFPAEKLSLLKEFDTVFGLKLKFGPYEEETVPAKILELVKSREDARLNKEFKKSDKLRDKIESLGYDIEDTDTGYVIKKNLTI